MTQKIVGLVGLGAGFYLFYIGSVFLGFGLLILGAGLYKGSEHGVIFYLGSDEDGDGDGGD